MSGKSFFPPYLNERSQGPAVKLLQMFLLAMEMNHLIVVDGDYGKETATGVRRLQRKLEVDADGNFGPETREAFRKQLGFDLNKLPVNIFEGENKPVGP